MSKHTEKREKRKEEKKEQAHRRLNEQLLKFRLA